MLQELPETTVLLIEFCVEGVFWKTYVKQTTKGGRINLNVIKAISAHGMAMTGADWTQHLHGAGECYHSDFWLTVLKDVQRRRDEVLLC